MIDYLREKGVQVEWSTTAESLETDQNDLPVVHVSRGLGEKDTIKAQYVTGCDGVHSWTRDQLQIPMDALSAPSEESTWGVMDIVPISDFRTSSFPAEGKMLTPYQPISANPAPSTLVREAGLCSCRARTV